MRPPRTGGRSVALQSVGTSGAAAAAVVAGLLLDVVIALRFGAGEQTDAFFVAARLPIGVVAVLLAGTNLVLVPILTRWLLERGRERALVGAGALLLGAVLLGTVVGALFALGAPLIVRVLAPGLDDPTSALAADLLRVLALVVPLTALAEALRSLLNAQHRFVAPAAMNVWLNGVAAAVVLLGPGDDVRVAAWAYVAGATARVLALLPSAARGGVRLPGRASVRALREPETRQAARLCVRPVAAAGLAPALRVAEQVLASFLPAGSISLLNYAYRLVLSIGGAVFFRSVIAVLAPRTATATSAGDTARVGRLTSTGVAVLTAVAVLLTVLLLTLSTPLSLVLFDRGSFARADAVLLGTLLAVLSTALVAEGLQRVLLGPFFAALDTRTALRNAVYVAATRLLLLPVVVLVLAGSSGALIGIVVTFVVAEHVGAAHAVVRLRRSGLADHVDVLGPLLRALGPAAAGIAVGLALRSALDLREVSGNDGAGSVLLAVVLTAATVLVAFILTERRRLQGWRTARTQEERSTHVA